MRFLPALVLVLIAFAAFSATDTLKSFRQEQTRLASTYVQEWNRKNTTVIRERGITTVYLHAPYSLEADGWFICRRYSFEDGFAECRFAKNAIALGW